ncbi:hypothetical protein Ctob_009311 [Chrysochromulina tobinii]|uniref:Uncharacterized protein n=1 Tax=Chrysochromulina tobinii TaxID=1460289 RepID=A0A0M0JLT0_9EUKA|nr:hypothetical protein Ctob_009311 [Chrysochromulina tobinii]|eukprot:KOO27519.1 hypothetical protein Ctob_009311 [Chrysochromulina sp. CCMP291]
MKRDRQHEQSPASLKKQLSMECIARCEGILSVTGNGTVSCHESDRSPEWLFFHA